MTLKYWYSTDLGLNDKNELLICNNFKANPRKSKSGKHFATVERQEILKLLNTLREAFHFDFNYIQLIDQFHWLPQCFF